MQQLEDAARSAAEVDRAIAGTHADAIEKVRALRRELIRLLLQASALTAAASERVDSVRVDARLTANGRVRRGRRARRTGPRARYGFRDTHFALGYTAAYQHGVPATIRDHPRTVIRTGAGRQPASRVVLLPAGVATALSDACPLLDLRKRICLVDSIVEAPGFATKHKPAVVSEYSTRIARNPQLASPLL